MKYIDYYAQEKEYWDEETQRRKIHLALIGRKTPPEHAVIELLKPGRQRKRKHG